MNGWVRLWPTAASHHAVEIDRLFFGYAAMVLLLSAPVFILMLVYAVKYRRGRPADRRHARNRNVWLETSWTVAPFLLTIGFFVYAAQLYFDLARPPPDALVIDVVAKQWMWKFQHPGGQREINDLHVPSGQPVKLVMVSQDVIHSFFVPALRIKQDVLPGRYTSLWFDADRPGVYALRCSQFCGLDHSLMGGRLYVQSAQAYAAWLEQAGAAGSLAQQGEALFRALGCSGCHGPASTRRAPKLDGVYGRPVALDDGRVVVADDQYIRDSILQPARDVAAGYAPIMPTFAHQVSEEQLQALVAYVKSLGTASEEAGHDRDR